MQSLVPAIILMIPPLPLPRRIDRVAADPRRYQSRVKALLPVWQNWVDFLRAGVGAFLLAQWVIAAEAVEDGEGLGALIVVAAIAGLGITFQTVRFPHRLQILVPLFFLSGLTIGMSGLVVGGFAVLVGWLFALGTGQLAVQAAAMAVALAVGGYVLGLEMLFLLNASLICIPLFLALVVHKPMLYAMAVGPSSTGRSRSSKRSEQDVPADSTGAESEDVPR